MIELPSERVGQDERCVGLRCFRGERRERPACWVALHPDDQYVTCIGDNLGAGEDSEGLGAERCNLSVGPYPIVFSGNHASDAASDGKLS